MKVKYIVIGLAVALVLTGAAFMVGRLLQTSAQIKTQQAMIGPNGEILSSGGSGAAIIVGSQGENSQSYQTTIEGAPELPERGADTMGQIQRIEDNSIFITPSSGLGVGVTIDENGKTKMSSVSLDENSSEMEIVITQDTQIYRDLLQPTSLETEDLPDVIQQEVELITIDDIGDQGVIAVWGQKRGERLTAEVILYIGF